MKSSSSSSSTTNLYNTTNYGAVTGANLEKMFGGDKTFVFGDSNSINQEANGGFGGGNVSPSNYSDMATSQTQTNKDSLDLGASVGVGGGSGGSIGMSSSDSGSSGGGVARNGASSASNLMPIIAVGGVLCVALLAMKRKTK